MTNLFDGLQKAAFAIVANTFGNAATWQPSAGGALVSATVLYKDATEKHGLSDVDFNIERYIMEYQRGDFEGLHEAVKNGDTERVTIETSEAVFLPFIVRRTETKYDGKTIVAYLNPVN